MNVPYVRVEETRAYHGVAPRLDEERRAVLIHGDARDALGDAVHDAIRLVGAGRCRRSGEWLVLHARRRGGEMSAVGLERVPRCARLGIFDEAPPPRGASTRPRRHPRDATRRRGDRTGPAFCKNRPCRREIRPSAIPTPPSRRGVRAWPHHRARTPRERRATDRRLRAVALCVACARASRLTLSLSLSLSH